MFWSQFDTNLVKIIWTISFPMHIRSPKLPRLQSEKLVRKTLFGILLKSPDFMKWSFQTCINLEICWDSGVKVRLKTLPLSGFSEKYVGMVRELYYARTYTNRRLNAFQISQPSKKGWCSFVRKLFLIFWFLFLLFDFTTFIFDF